MHILEQYALSCGVKISEPYIYTEFFPIPFDKYITFQPSSMMESERYDYFEEVFQLLSPHLERLGIKVVQVGGKDDKLIKGAYNALGTTIPQMAYVISNAVMHFGSDSCCIHFASYFRKKIVSLTSVLYKQHMYPYWSDEKDYTVIEPDRDGKPSYSNYEFPKQINKIKPEQIVQAVLDLLEVNESVDLNTIKIGSDFLVKNLHVIPNCVAQVNVPFVVSRLDIEYDQEMLIKQLEISKVHIITKQPIHPDIIFKYKQNILSVTYNIEKENQPRFVEFLQQQGVKYQLITELNEEEIKDLKLDYMDYGVIAFVNKPQRSDFEFCDTENLKYVSSKYFISNKQIYPSLAAVKADKPVSDLFKFDPQPIIDNDEFWEQGENFYFLTNDQ